MNERTSARIDRVSSVGQAIVKTLIKQPVREAVREAIDEERLRELAHTEESSSSGRQGMMAEPSSEGQETNGRGIPVKTILALVALAGGILLVKRLRSGDSETEPYERDAGQRQGEAAPGEETSRVSGERFSSTPGSPSSHSRSEE